MEQGIRQIQYIDRRQLEISPSADGASTGHTAIFQGRSLTIDPREYTFLSILQESEGTVANETILHAVYGDKVTPAAGKQLLTLLVLGIKRRLVQDEKAQLIGQDLTSDGYRLIDPQRQLTLVPVDEVSDQAAGVTSTNQVATASNGYSSHPLSREEVNTLSLVRETETRRPETVAATNAAEDQAVRLIGLQAAADRLGVSYWTVLDYVKKGKLPVRGKTEARGFHKSGNLLSENDVLALAEARQMHHMTGTTNPRTISQRATEVTASSHVAAKERGLVTMTEAVSILGVHINTLARYVRNGSLQVREQGKGSVKYLSEEDVRNLKDLLVSQNSTSRFDPQPGERQPIYFSPAANNLRAAAQKEQRLGEILALLSEGQRDIYRLLATMDGLDSFTRNRLINQIEKGVHVPTAIQQAGKLIAGTVLKTVRAEEVRRREETHDPRRDREIKYHVTVTHTNPVTGETYDDPFIVVHWDNNADARSNSSYYEAGRDLKDRQYRMFGENRAAQLTRQRQDREKEMKGKY